MPDIEGHDFPPYAYADWPRHVTRSDGTSMTANSETEADEFLKGDADAIKAYKAAGDANAKARAIQIKADADVAKIRHDAAMAQADAAAKAAEARAEPAKAAPVADKSATKPAA